MRASPEMIRRVEVSQATLNRFKDKPFRFGLNDCVRMTAHHLRRLGYRVSLPNAGEYRSRRAAVRLLKARGYDTLAQALDGLGLESIAPAAAIVGDIVELPAADELGALTIAMGNGRVLGFHEAVAGATVMQPVSPIRAWRVRA